MQLKCIITTKYFRKVLQFIHAPNKNILDLKWKTEFNTTINFIAHKIKLSSKILILLTVIILCVLEDSLKACPNKIHVLAVPSGRHRSCKTWCFSGNVIDIDVAGPY